MEFEVKYWVQLLDNFEVNVNLLPDSITEHVSLYLIVFPPP